MSVLSSAARRLLGVRLFRMFGRPLGRLPGAKQNSLDLRVLCVPDLLPLCADAELNLRPDAVVAAYQRGDLCVAAFDGDRLAGYCWVAFRPLPHLDGVWVRFEPAVAWAYKSLVRPAYRGRGIAAALYRFLDPECLNRGCSRSVICVERHNRPSISAALRAGYASDGYGAYLLRSARLLAWSSPRAKERGIAFFLPGGP